MAGRLKEGFPEEVALPGPSLKRVEMGMGEGRAIRSEGGTNGSGVGWGAGVRHAESLSPWRVRQRGAVANTWCSMRPAAFTCLCRMLLGACLRDRVPSRHVPESHPSCSSSTLQTGWEARWPESIHLTF